MEDVKLDELYFINKIKIFCSCLNYSTMPSLVLKEVNRILFEYYFNYHAKTIKEKAIFHSIYFMGKTYIVFNAISSVLLKDITDYKNIVEYLNSLNADEILELEAKIYIKILDLYINEMK